MKINAQCEAWLGQLTKSPVFKKNAVRSLVGRALTLHFKREGRWALKMRKEIKLCIWCQRWLLKIQINWRVRMSDL